MEFLNYIYPVLGIGTLLGIFFVAFRNGRKERVENAQQRTIEAQNTQLGIMRDRLADVEKENAKLHLLLDTVISALKTEGKLITIDGNMVTISDDGNAQASVRPRRKTTVTKAVQATTTIKQESEKTA